MKALARFTIGPLGDENLTTDRKREVMENANEVYRLLGTEERLAAEQLLNYIGKLNVVN